MFVLAASTASEAGADSHPIATLFWPWKRDVDEVCHLRCRRSLFLLHRPVSTPSRPPLSWRSPSPYPEEYEERERSKAEEGRVDRRGRLGDAAALIKACLRWTYLVDPHSRLFSAIDT
jgi:hypothetical protein